MGQPTFGDGFSGDQDAVSKEIAEKVKSGLLQTYDTLWAGDVNRISHMPVESFLPMVFLRYLVGFSKDKSIS